MKFPLLKYKIQIILTNYEKKSFANVLVLNM